MTTTWRSPLGILMGARRNDDDDLELRWDDYYHPTRSNNNNTPIPATPNQAYVNQTPASTKSGITSYLPFSYFGLKSPAPTPAKDNKYYNNVNISQDNMSPIPPQRSFPPHISEETQQDIIDSSGHNDSTIQQDRQNSNESQQQYSASHPWFNQLELTIDEGGDDNYNNNTNNNNNVHEHQSTEKKQSL